VIHRFIRFVLFPLLLSLAGCSVYLDDYSYSPRPMLAEIPANAGGPTTRETNPPVTALASIVGVRQDDPKTKIPPSVEARIQLNNDSGQPVNFDPHTLQLSDASFMNFDPPILQPPDQTITIDNGQTANVTAYFPFPAGRTIDNTDMNSLQLRWRVALGDGRNVTQNVIFRRSPNYYYYRPYYYYDPWMYGPYPYPYRYPYYSRVVIVHPR
jgi:hypothetical protein